ncbi:transposable element Tcb2 transposase [Trichonephila clavipes]|nr:transposable element Tcb2 transposase [Trichonephila clavipes]
MMPFFEDNASSCRSLRGEESFAWWKLVGQLGYCAALDATHRLLRLEWCRARGNWTAAEWNPVVFCDESRFNFSSDDNRVRVWRPRGEHLNSAFALQQHSTLTASVMVWGVIACNTWSPLVLIRGPMTVQRYVHDILQPQVLSLMQRLPAAIFQQDNNRVHTAKLPLDCLRTITTFLWSARSPYLSPLEHTWDYLGLRDGHPTSLNELESRLPANIERNVSRHHTDLLCHNARSYCIVHLGYRVFNKKGTMDGRGGSHLPQCTTSREEGQILRMAVTDRSDTSRTVAQHIESVTHHSVSARTIRHRLQKSGLSTRHPFLGLPLTQYHRHLRHQWCDERRM